MKRLCYLALLVLPAVFGAEPPRVFVISSTQLQQTKARLAAGDESLQPALARLRKEADQALQLEPVSVLVKPLVAPSGDKHDYLSRGPYWWPDPNKPDGLPYIVRDGQVNPESRVSTDYVAFARLMSATETLGLAYYFTGHEPYAEHAARLLRVWFIDSGTRMNPHLRYAQGVPGRTDGRSTGIIDLTGLIHMLDGVALINRSEAWTAADAASLNDWCALYLDWLLTSENGKAAHSGRSNHGTWYDAQVAQLALHLGRMDLARKVLAEGLQLRIARQIEPDGRQPQELVRTRSLVYSTFNLRGFLILARQAEHVGVDWWTYATTDGRALRTATSFLAPYVDPERAWIKKDLTDANREELRGVLALAVQHFSGPEFTAARAFLARDQYRSERWNLLTPLAARMEPLARHHGLIADIPGGLRPGNTAVVDGRKASPGGTERRRQPPPERPRGAPR